MTARRTDATIGVAAHTRRQTGPATTAGAAPSAHVTPDEAAHDAEVIERGRRVIRIEHQALAALEMRLDASFAAAVRLIAGSPGRVIVCGVGKSGLVGRKIAATLTSTGTPATFLHPADSVHGDLGIVGEGDVAILISKSGESQEVLALVEHLQGLGVDTIALTGTLTSMLARHCDVVLETAIAEEACPHDLAPTTSTTAAMAMGDALAVALLLEKGFQREDFARLHPGGALGRRLLIRVADVMVSDALPMVPPSATMIDAVVQLAERRGTLMVVDDEQRLLGVVTAGDLTRLIRRDESGWLRVTATAIMTRTPRTAQPDELGSAAVYRMEQAGIMALPVIDAARHVVGIVHLHDLLREGAA